VHQYSEAQRSAILDEHIANYVRQGYQVAARTPTTCQLIKQKRFNLLIAIILFCLAIFPFVIYMLFYVNKKGGSVYLQVDAGGVVHATKS
jgi:hypothetical protein